MTAEEYPFRFVSKVECPDPKFLSAYLFFSSGGAIDYVSHEDYDAVYWKVRVDCTDGGR